MSEIKTRADFVDAVAKMVRMCDEAGIEPTWKQQGFLCIYSGVGMPEIRSVYSAVEFPLAILEGRPVFVGDELFGKDGCKHKIIGLHVGMLMYEAEDGHFPHTYLSWNPPKPKTVMVEMLREDAESFTFSPKSPTHSRVAQACRKALDKPEFADNLKAGLELEERVKIDLTRREAETLSNVDGIPMFLYLLIRQALANR
jgi:hypothetical protein